jgi:hypothetical protein
LVLGPHLVNEIPSLGPYPIVPALGIVTVVAALDGATPTNTRWGTTILSAIQPVVVFRALDRVHAGFVDRVRVLRHSDKHVISIGRVISNTATFKAAMVRHLVVGI